jgi:hypothetical protein
VQVGSQGRRRAELRGVLSFCMVGCFFRWQISEASLLVPGKDKQTGITIPGIGRDWSPTCLIRPWYFERRFTGRHGLGPQTVLFEI